MRRKLLLLIYFFVVSDWFEGTQAAVCLSFILNVGALVVLAVAIILNRLNPSSNTHFNFLKIVALVLLSLTGRQMKDIS